MDIHDVLQYIEELAGRHGYHGRVVGGKFATTQMVLNLNLTREQLEPGLSVAGLVTLHIDLTTFTINEEEHEEDS